MAIILSVIFSIILWIMFGWSAAGVLIGDCTFYYPVTIFGPLNLLDESDQYKGTPGQNALIRKNYRNRFFLICGGCISFLFMLFYYTYKMFANFYKHLIYIFGNDKKDK